MSHESNELTRRDFARAAAAAIAVPVLAPLAACASAAPTPAPAPAIAPDSTAAVPRPQEPTPLARALGEAIRAQYGDRLTEEQFAKVQRGISGVLQTAERLRQFPLPIATEPSFTYRVPGGAA